jgi:hypothetical protein
MYIGDGNLTGKRVCQKCLKTIWDEMGNLGEVVDNMDFTNQNTFLQEGVTGIFYSTNGNLQMRYLMNDLYLTIYPNTGTIMSPNQITLSTSSASLNNPFFNLNQIPNSAPFVQFVRRRFWGLVKMTAQYEPPLMLGIVVDTNGAVYLYDLQETANVPVLLSGSILEMEITIFRAPLSLTNV